MEKPVAKPKKSTQKKPDAGKFTQRYLLNGQNGTEAAIYAGYSEKTAHAQASRLLKTVKVMEAIAEHKKVKMDGFIWDKRKKLEFLQEIAEKSIRDTEDKDGNVKLENASAAVSAIKEHNLMQGDNAPTETNSNVTVSNSLAERLLGGSKR